MRALIIIQLDYNNKLDIVVTSEHGKTVCQVYNNFFVKNVNSIITVNRIKNRINNAQYLIAEVN